MVAIFYQKRSAYGKTIDRRQGADRTVCNAAYYSSRTAGYETERGLTEERYHDKIELSKEFVEARKSGKTREAKAVLQPIEPKSKRILMTGSAKSP